VSESRVDESVGRVLLNRMRVGLFDPLETQPYAALGKESINSSATQDLLLDLTLQSLVLLKNHDQLLPLTQGVKLAVIGPHTNTTRDLVRPHTGSRFDV
jgi:beta-glucosidase-like glycosyl hydrolase